MKITENYQYYKKCFFEKKPTKLVSLYPEWSQRKERRCKLHIKYEREDITTDPTDIKNNKGILWTI